jgi:hypothetical protein
MEIKVFLMLIVLQVCHLSFGAILKLAGTVPDRGFVINAARIEPAKNSEMKIYLNQNNVWHLVSKPELIPADALVKVQAP